MTPGAQPIALFGRPFWFLRHGETESNRLQLTAGSTDVELNDAGRQQAAAAAAALARRGIDAIYCSPLKRARDTAACVAAALDLEVTVIDDLAERNWGELEGRPRHLRVREAKPRGGESPDEFAQRTLRGLARIPCSTLPLLVAHSGTFRVLCRVLGVAASETPVGNARAVRFERGKAPVGAWRLDPLPAGLDIIA